MNGNRSENSADKLSKAQRETLARIASGERPTVLQSKSVDVLLARGLIVEVPHEYLPCTVVYRVAQ
jgi:hypothetical protein